MTVGEYLRRIREEKQISLEQVSSGTNIRVYYLEAIEADNWEQLPSQAQGRGFARLYAAYLGLSSRDVFDEVEQMARHELGGAPETEPALKQPAAILVERPQPFGQKPGKKRSSLSATSRERNEEALSPVTAPPVSQRIFNEIGVELRRQREALGLSLDDVERLTKIREFYVFALENGRVDDLPSSVQGRGMLNNYASFLSLNADALQMRYAEALQQRRLEKLEQERVEKKEGVAVMGKEPLTGWRRFLTPDLLVGGMVFFVLFSLVVWGAVKMINTSIPRTEPTISSISEILVGETEDITALTDEPTTQLTEDTPEATQWINVPQTDMQATIAAVEPGPIQVVVVAYQRAYMKITVDGNEKFSGRVIPGNVYAYTGTYKISLLTGNAAAMQVYYNQQDLGVLGPLGQVAEIEFTRQEMMTPTPRFSPTPTLTPPPTLTALPTNTPMPTATVPTPTITPALTLKP
jgi:cytoskeletal protein RodZ